MEFNSIIVKMIKRVILPYLKKLAKQYPVITITGPRQSGKTTLAQTTFNDYAYYSLEDLDIREFATNDPRGFLSQNDYMIIDEVQKVPSLVSYIQTVVDQKKRKAQFILTGSHQFELTHTISQSLAGRTALITLLPFSAQELKEEISLEKLLYRGFYPRIIDQELNPTQALSFYTSTYIERDLRQIKEIKNLSQFESFLKLCAANIGQLLNKSKMANDIGVDAKTIDSWLSVLQASYILFLLPPHFNNFRKRIVKSPKLYFYDVGLASYLLGVKNVDHIHSHPLKGNLFENLIILEKVKNKLNQLQDIGLYFFRDNSGNEVDLLEEDVHKIHSFEIKLASTLNTKQFKGLNFYKDLNPNNSTSYLIYGGQEKKTMYTHLCIGWRQFIKFSSIRA